MSLVCLSAINLKLSLLVCFVVFAFYIEKYNCDTHRASHPIYDSDIGHTFFQQTLFSRNTTTPKEYVVGFKYDADVFSTVIVGAQISTDVPHSWGHAEFQNGIDIHDTRYAKANIHIPSTTNFSVDVSMLGSPGLGYVGMARFLHIKLFRPRSCALICVNNKMRPKTTYRQFEFGKRQTGDFLLHLRKEYITSADERLPRHLIEYKNLNVTLTSVSIRVNTTMAVIFTNKITMNEHEFSSIIYGLNRDKFMIHWTVYGNRI